MTNEEFERHMAIVAENQAKFSENLSRQQERLEDEKKQAELDRRIQALVSSTQALLGSMSLLRDALISLTHHAERFEREMADLVARGKETDGRLNALILIVERHISGHQ